ncbi:MAG TPA: M48 family metallopeptidase [Lacipirellulaceae bacterium]|nr:M48 family metallopeptidase [Lacipirellulaceae bacterium]
MSDAKRGFSSIGFAKTFVLPGLLVFLVPVASLLFFLHAQSRFNAQAREEILSEIRQDASLAPEEREQAIAYFTEHPFSELIQNDEFAADVDPQARFDYATFRWMIRLSALSIAVGISVFLLAGLCVLLSLWSQRVQYLSLSAGWQLLRLYGALQTAVQGLLLFALSYWVTALWFQMYSMKLVLVAAVLAVIAVGAVIAAIFKRSDTTHIIEGKVIDKSSALPLWKELNAICAKIGTSPPDQIIAGIDDNFFVTEHPVIVDGKTLCGRTLYVSLSLLRQMNGAEAASVLAHEMAHFSGKDTLYSKKISPLLVRYANYLEALYTAGVTRPIFYFMHCFRALFELSLSKLSREREFRADRIAMQITSPRDFSGAMLRIAAYSKFRSKIQEELFREDQVLKVANISQQIGEGFQRFALSFASQHDTSELATSHPFDTHPPMVERLSAVGVQLTPQYAAEILATRVDGRWFRTIENAQEIEQQQWQAFEDQFRQYHEETLAYRLFPETDEERAIVAKAFPQVFFDGLSGTLTLDCRSLQFTGWAPIPFREITQFTLNDNKTLEIRYGQGGKQKKKLPVKDLHQREQALEAINRYYNRYLHAAAYQEQKKLAATAS